MNARCGGQVGERKNSTVSSRYRSASSVPPAAGASRIPVRALGDHRFQGRAGRTAGRARRWAEARQVGPAVGHQHDEGLRTLGRVGVGGHVRRPVQRHALGAPQLEAVVLRAGRPEGVPAARSPSTARSSVPTRRRRRSTRTAAPARCCTRRGAPCPRPSTARRAGPAVRASALPRWCRRVRTARPPLGPASWRRCRTRGRAGDDRPPAPAGNRRARGVRPRRRRTGWRATALRRRRAA